MLLRLGNRISLLGVLPREGNFLTLKIIRKLQEELTPSEEEIKELKLIQTDGRITWDAKKDTGKEIEIGEKANDVIVLALSKLNDQKKLQLEHMDIYDMFIHKNGEKDE